ncbi:hypothetical protein OG963_15250 [Streptomyces sp. NBC_01707]|uniref:hypothetical protein n=1 Tax=Streptomyces sp. NBC_01707 TaxID=2975914 RepID=UPI00352C7129
MTGTLYHFTNPDGWDKIRSLGVITPQCHRAPHDLFEGPVVWLQDTDNVDDNGLSSWDDKNEVRIAVRPTLSMQYWPAWRAGVATATTLGRTGSPESWYVTRRGIPEDAWGEVLNLRSGAPLRSGPATHSVADWGHLPDLDEWATMKQFWDSLQPTQRTAELALYRFRVAEEVKSVLDSTQSEQRRRAAWRSMIEMSDLLVGRPTTG